MRASQMERLKNGNTLITLTEVADHMDYVRALEFWAASLDGATAKVHVEMPNASEARVYIEVVSNKLKLDVDNPEFHKSITKLKSKEHHESLTRDLSLETPSERYGPDATDLRYGPDPERPQLPNYNDKDPRLVDPDHDPNPRGPKPISIFTDQGKMPKSKIPPPPPDEEESKKNHPKNKEEAEDEPKDRSHHKGR